LKALENRLQEDPDYIPNGKAAAALLSGAAGIALLGIFSVLVQFLPPLRTVLTLNAAVGVLSGKTIIPVVIWVILWLVMDYSWKGKELDFKKILIWTRVLLGMGLLGTFPLFYRLFNAG
jgi:hypothetical protein